MGEELAFHKAMSDDSNDEHTRLVFADWLDEHGRPVAAARLRWWAGALAHLRAGAGPSGAGTSSREEERRSMPEWVARLNQVRGVRAALEGLMASGHRDYRRALHAGELKGLGLLSGVEGDAAREHAKNIDPVTAHEHELYAALNGVLRENAHEHVWYPPEDAQWYRNAARGNPTGPDYETMADHARSTQKLAEYVKMNPPPTEEAVHLARPIGWLKDKLFGPAKPGPVRAELVDHPYHPDDGITHRAFDPESGKLLPTAAQAAVEQSAVEQALRANGWKGAFGRESTEKRQQYTGLIRRMLDHPLFRGTAPALAYRDAARTMNVPTDLEDPSALHNAPSVRKLASHLGLFVRLARDILAHNDPEERTRVPGPARPQQAVTHEASAPAPSPEPELPGDGSAAFPAPVEHAPEPNMHKIVHQMLQEHKGDLNKTKARLKAEHGMTHQEAHEATRNFLALHTGMKGLGAFKRALKKDPDAKLAKPKAGEAVQPQHLTNVAYDRTPINKGIEGTALAFHLRQIGQDHKDLTALTDRALARQSDPNKSGGDPYAAIGKALAKRKDPRAGWFNWNTMEDSLIRDARASYLIRSLVTQPHGLEGQSEESRERRYWDAIHNGFVGGKANTASAFWARAEKAGWSKDDLAASIKRLRDRALDREYVAAIRAEKPSRRDPEHDPLHWRGVLGAAPSEQHAKFARAGRRRMLNTQTSRAWQWLHDHVYKLTGYKLGDEAREYKPKPVVPLAPSTFPVTKPTTRFMHRRLADRIADFAQRHAEKHADEYASAAGLAREQAHKILVHAITHVATRMSERGVGQSGVLQAGGKRLRVRVPAQKLARAEHAQPGAGAAIAAADSTNHEARLAVARHVLAEAGLKPAVVRAALAHSPEQGVRPSVAAIVLNAANSVLARYAAAWMGLLTGERRMTVFHPGEGEDVLHMIDSPYPPAHVGEYLGKSGAPRFTMEQRGKGTRVYVVSPMDLIDVETAARGLGGAHQKAQGTAFRLGSGSQENAESRSAFRQVIEDAEREAQYGTGPERPRKLAAIEPADRPGGTVLLKVPTAPQQPAAPEPPRPSNQIAGPVFFLPQ